MPLLLRQLDVPPLRDESGKHVFICHQISLSIGLRLSWCLIQFFPCLSYNSKPQMWVLDCSERSKSISGDNVSFPLPFFVYYDNAHLFQVCISLRIAATLTVLIGVWSNLGVGVCGRQIHYDWLNNHSMSRNHNWRGPFLFEVIWRKGKLLSCETGNGWRGNVDLADSDHA